MMGVCSLYQVQVQEGILVADRPPLDTRDHDINSPGRFLGLGEVRSDVGSAVAAGGSDEPGFKIGKPDVSGHQSALISIQRQPEIRAIDQDPANTRIAHLAEGDLLGSVGYAGHRAGISNPGKCSLFCARGWRFPFPRNHSDFSDFSPRASDRGAAGDDRSEPPESLNFPRPMIPRPWFAPLPPCRQSGGLAPSSQSISSQAF